MQTPQHTSLLDSILDSYRPQLGEDYTAYRNHCQRVLHLTGAFAVLDDDAAHKVAVAAAFHDLGIWTAHTFDYLAPSVDLARAYLAAHDLADWSDEISAMIDNHHKFTRFRKYPEWLVEPFRRADWADVSRGRLRFGLPGSTVNEVMAAFPNAGFHKRLVQLTRQRFRSHPFSPLPMMRL